MAILIHQKRRLITVIAAIAMATVLGSIHAFSIFVPEWQKLAGADRAGVSLVYSIALVSLTVTVLFGHRLFRLLTAPYLFLVVGTVAGIGLLFAANTESLFWLYVYYGLLFGAANGLGYGYALQLSAQATPEHRGLSMCLITAFYAVGATLSPFLFSHLIFIGGNAGALYAAAAIIFLVSLVAALLVVWSGAEFTSESPASTTALCGQQYRTRLLLWIAYGASVTSGLMIIGHAYSVAWWKGYDPGFATLATVVVALGNMSGGFSAVYLSDRVSNRMLLIALPVFGVAGLFFLLISGNDAATIGLAGFGLVGYSYGALIAIYPVTVNRIFGTLAAARIYGQIFTAWGFAGLVGPWLSGRLFDLTQSYTTALIVGILFNIIAVYVVYCGLPRSPKPETLIPLHVKNF